MIRAFTRAVRAFTAFAALLALLGGVPALLLRIAPLHPPSRWPQWTDLVDAATRPDDGHLFIVALSLTAWAGWAAFALSAVLEAVARARGAPVQRLPGLAAPQRLAAALMTSTAVLVSSAAVIAPTAAARPPAATAVAEFAPSLVADVATDVVAGSRDVPAADETLPRVTVQRGDTLWDLAERHLGHGSRYPEIAALNYGRPQPDGRSLASDHWLYPGWTLLLPADDAPATPPGADTTREYTVRAHDTLWDIAETHLGDGHRYPEIVALNRDHPQLDGHRLTDPDVIRPGWTIRLPTVAEQPPPSTAPPPSPSPSPSTAPSPSRSTARVAADPSSSPPSTGDAATPTDAAATDPAEAQPAHRTQDSGIQLSGSYLPWSLAGAITAAAAMVWLRRRRHPAADPDADEFALPDVVETIVRDTSRRPETRPPADLGDRAAAVPPQEQQPPGGSGLVGPGAASAARAALVSALASGGPREPDHRAEVVIDGTTLTHLIDDAAASLSPWPRLHIADSLDQALTLLEAHLLHRSRVLDENTVPDLDALRAQAPDEEPLPPILLITGTPPPAAAKRLRTALTIGAEMGVTAILLGPWNEGPTLHVSVDGHVRPASATTPGADAPDDATRDDVGPDPDDEATGGPDEERIAVLDIDTTVTILHTLREAHTGQRPDPLTTPGARPSGPTAPPHDPDPHPVPEPRPRPGAPRTLADTDQALADAHHEGDPGPAPAGAATAGPRAFLRVLGDPDVLNTTTDGRPLRAKAAELAVFLACHPEGADARSIGEHLESDSRLRQADQHVHTNVSNLRHVLAGVSDDHALAEGVSAGGRPVRGAWERMT